MSKSEKFEYEDKVIVTDKNTTYYQMTGSVISLRKNHSDFYWVKIGGFNHPFKEEQLDFVPTAGSAKSKRLEKAPMFKIGDTVQIHIPGDTLDTQVGVIKAFLVDGKANIYLESCAFVNINTDYLKRYKKVEPKEAPFYIVWNPEGHNPTQKFDDLGVALKNAQGRVDQCTEECEYYVLKVVKKFGKKLVTETFEYSKDET